MFEQLLNGTTEGLIWGLLALGFYIAFRLLDFADMTCEGSFVLGGATFALLTFSGVNPFLATVLSFVFGSLAGMFTGFLHTKLKIPPILSGILTMTALYSINLHIMGPIKGALTNPTVAIPKDDKIVTILKQFLPMTNRDLTLLFTLVVVLLMIGFLYWFFGTELGCAIRATGTNEKMCRAQGINTDTTKIVGLALANGLIALSGCIYSQYTSLADVKLGIGSIVIGLAAIIIGEAVFAWAKNFFLRLLGIVIGAIIYRVILAMIIYFGLPSEDMKLFTALIVIVALGLMSCKGQIKAFFTRLFGKKKAEVDK